MSIRKSIHGIGFIVALGAPVVALAGGIWETTNDEAGSRIVAPQFGAAASSATIPAMKPLCVGDISPDRQYIYNGDEGGWQVRPMSYRFDAGHLVHVDDPVGHMHRLADNTPFTAQEKAALARSGGR